MAIFFGKRTAGNAAAGKQSIAESSSRITRSTLAELEKKKESLRQGRIQASGTADRARSFSADDQKILAQIVAGATKILRHESEALKDEAMRMISPEVESVQRALTSGVSSPEEIDKNLGQVSGLCEEVIPERAWICFPNGRTSGARCLSAEVPELRQERRNRSSYAEVRIRVY